MDLLKIVKSILWGLLRCWCALWFNDLSEHSLNNKMRPFSSLLRLFGTHPLKKGILWFLVLAIISSVAYAVPGNDNFADAQLLAGTSGTVNSNNADATAETNEPNHYGLTAAEVSVWYRWTAPSSGNYYFSTLGSDFDTVMAAYTGGTLDALTQIASNDQYNSDTSQISFSATANTVYFIAVDGYYGDVGDVTLSWGTALPPPANDNFVDAQIVSGASGTTNGTNVSATTETNEPNHNGLTVAGASVWYRWTAPSSGNYYFSTLGSDFDTVMAAYTGGTLDALTQIASNDQYNSDTSQISFSATANTVYFIAVDGYNGVVGDVTLSWGAALPVPANDNFADAVVITESADPFDGTMAPDPADGTTIDATDEVGEPVHDTASNRTSVWYRWTPSKSAVYGVVAVTPNAYTLSQTGSAAVAVYTGSTLNSLTRVVSTREFAPFPVTAGTQYFFAVDSYDAASLSTFTLLLFELDPPPPAVENFSVVPGDGNNTLHWDAVEDVFSYEISWRLASEPITTSHHLDFVSAPDVSYTHQGLTNGTTYFYKIKALGNGSQGPDSDWVSGTPTGNSSAPGVPIYSNIQATSLTVTAPSMPTGATSLTLQKKLASGADSTYADVATGLAANSTRNVTGLTDSTTYTFRFQAVGAGGTTSGAGANVSTLALPSTPPNDNFANAQLLSGANGTANGSNVGATAEAGEPTHYNPASVSVWYRWMAPSSGQYTFDTLGSNFDTVLAIYSGTTLGALTKIVSNDDFGGPQSKVSFSATAGTQYWIAVDGYSSSSKGSIVLNWAVAAPPPSAPASVTATGGDHKVDLVWSAVDGATSYKVTRVYVAVRLYTESTFNVPTNTFTDTEVGNLSTYYYEVSAINSGGESPKTLSNRVVTGVVPDAPTGLMAQNFDDRIELNWQAVPDAAGYRVWRSTTAGGPYTQQAFPFEAPTDVTTFIDRSIAPGITYFYVVEAWNAKGTGARSNEASATASLARVTFSNVQSTSLKVHLPSLPSAATSYSLQRTAVAPILAPSWSRTGLRLWLRGDTLTKTGSSTVSKWVDLSGNKHHATQSDAQMRPIWVDGAVGGRPAVRFDGMDDVLSFPTQSSLRSVFAVVSHATGEQDWAPLLGSTPNHFHGGEGGELFSGQYTSDAVQNAQGWIDGVATPPLSMSKPTSPEIISLITSSGVEAERIANQDRGDGRNWEGRNWNGDYAEILLFDSVLSQAERESVEAYLKRKYGLGIVVSSEANWTTIATNLSSSSTFDDTGLTLDTTYWYRVVANSPVGNTTGPAAAVTTLVAAPGVPPAPVVSDITLLGLKITAPALPTGTEALLLQHKLAAQSDAEYEEVFDTQTAGDIYASPPLKPDSGHDYRWVAIGQGGPTFGPATRATTLAPPYGAGQGLRGQYYATPSFENLAFERLDPKLDFDWGTGNPGPSVAQNGFSVRWEGEFEAQYSENYVFTLDFDENVQMWIDGQLVLSELRWPDRLSTAPRALVAGERHSVKIEFREDNRPGSLHLRGKNAHLNLLWSSPTQELEVVPTSQLYPATLTAEGHGLRGQYYEDRFFGWKRFSRVDPQIAFNWGWGAPSGEMQPDSFSVYWSGKIKAPKDGTYTFDLPSDDAARVWIGNTLVYDSMNEYFHQFSPFPTIVLEKDHQYDIKIQYLELVSLAACRLTWNPNGTMEDVPSLALTPAAADSTPPALPVRFAHGDAAVFDDYNGPQTLTAGKKYTVSVKMKNAGFWVNTCTWQGWWNGQYVLRPAAWSNNTTWGITKTPPVTLAAPTDPGFYDACPDGTGPIYLIKQDATFTFEITAPDTPGTYPFQWNMGRNDSDVGGFQTSMQPIMLQVVGNPASSRMRVLETDSNSVKLLVPDAPQDTNVTGWTIQRASVTAPPAPSTSGIVTWLRGDDLAQTKFGTSVSNWPGGAVQTNANAQPRYAPAALNGHGVAQFVAGRQWMNLTGNYDTWNGLSAFVVARPTTKTNWGRLFELSNGPGQNQIAFTRQGAGDDIGYFIGGAQSGSLSAPGALSGSDWRVLSVLQNAPSPADPTAPTAVSIYRDGQQIGSGPVPAPANGTRGTNLLAASVYGNDTPFAGDIAEVLIYNRALSEAERQATQNYLDYKYGFANVPADAVWETVQTGVAPGSQLLDEGRSPDSVYWYRCFPDGQVTLASEPVRAQTLPAPPAAPPKPVAQNVGTRTVTLEVPAPPARANLLVLERKLAEQTNEQFVIVPETRDGNTTSISGLEPETDYSFRWVAKGIGGETPGAALDVTTAVAPVPPPRAPDAPSFGDVTSTTIKVIVPLKGDDATSLSLQQKRTDQNDNQFVTINTGLQGDEVVTFTVDATWASYSFRAVAVGPGGQTPGKVASTRANYNPGTPAAPVVTLTGPISVSVRSPGMPKDRPVDSFALQMRFSEQDDEQFVTIAEGLGVGAVTPVTGLFPGQSYTFRYLGVIESDWTPGATASITMPTPTSLWSSGEPISCFGIRSPAQFDIVPGGSAVRLMSYVATDWDERIDTTGAFAEMKRHSDPCSYTWSASAGSFVGGQNVGQSVKWIAPTTPGVYTLTLVVDDANNFNTKLGDQGTRDDAAHGFNDAPQTFTVNVTVP